MKLRHAAALSLVSWSLVIPEAGKTVPKDCANCAVTWKLARLALPDLRRKPSAKKRELIMCAISMRTQRRMASG